MTKKDIILANLEAALLIEKSKQTALKFMFDNPQYSGTSEESRSQIRGIRFHLRMSEATAVRIRNEVIKLSPKRKK